MASETELERLVIRLIGDASEYKKMLEDSQKATEEAARHLGNISEQMGKSFVTQGVIVADALESIGHKMHEFAVEAIRGFAETEAAEVRLQANLRSHGRDVATLTEDYIDFAKELQKVTTIDKDATIAMLARAEAMGVTGEAAKRAVKEAAAIGAMNRAPAENFIRMTSMLAQGNLGRIGAFMPIPEGMKSDTEKLAYVHAQLAKNMEAVYADSSTLEGMYRRMESAITNAKNSLGEFAVAFKPVLEQIRLWAEEFQNLDPEIRKSYAALIGLIAAFPMLLAVLSTAKVVVGFLAEGFTLLKFAFAAVGGGSGLLLITLGALVAIIGIQLVSALKDAVNWANGSTEAIDMLTEAIKRNQEASQQWDQNYRKVTQQILQAGEAMPNSSKQSYFEAEAAKAQRDLEMYQAFNEAKKKSLADAQEAYNRVDTGPEPFRNVRLSDAKAVLDAAKSDAAAAETEFRAAKERVAQLKDAIDNLKKAKASEHDSSMKDLETFIEKLRDQMDAIDQTSEQAELAKIRRKGGLSEAETAPAAAMIDAMEARKVAYENATNAAKMLEEAEDSLRTAGMSEIQKQVDAFSKVNPDTEGVARFQKILEEAKAKNEAAEKTKQLEESVKSLTESLRIQAVTFGLDSAAAEVMKLKLQGATDEQLKAAKASAEEIARKQQKKKDDDERNKKIQERVDEGLKLEAKFASPQEKLQSEWNNITELFNSGTITLETYTRAMQDAYEQAHKDYTMQFKSEGVDAVLKGSAEAAKRFAEFKRGTLDIPGVKKPEINPRTGVAGPGSSPKDLIDVNSRMERHLERLVEQGSVKNNTQVVLAVAEGLA